MTTQQAINHVQSRMGWRFVDTEILNEDKMEWATVAMTTHLQAKGEEEMSYLVIGVGTNFVTLSLSTTPVLMDWLERPMPVKQGE